MNPINKSLRQLFIPIYLEMLSSTLTGMIDTVMVSSVGDYTVGAVGTANTYISMFIIMFSVISTGMTAVMTVYIGAGKLGTAHQAMRLGLCFNLATGSILSLLLGVFSGNILQLIGIADSLLTPARTYLSIIGGTCILNALIPVYSGYLRAFGHSRPPSLTAAAGNAVNLILNAVFLFAFHMGVAGVAYATVISKCVTLAGNIFASHKYIQINDPDRESNRCLLMQIVKIGLPSALETALYNAAMTLIISLLNRMDSAGLHVTARAYTAQITNFSYCVGAALAQANAIIIGWNLGAKRFDECNKSTKQTALFGIVIAVGLAIFFAAASGAIMNLFTNDPYMKKLVGNLLLIDIILEIGRVTNLVFGSALKTSGDAVFTTIIAVIFMYLCAVGGTYWFGIRWNWLVTGAYVGMTLDECVRAVCMVIRWKSGKWRNKLAIAQD